MHLAALHVPTHGGSIVLLAEMTVSSVKAGFLIAAPGTRGPRPQARWTGRPAQLQLASPSTGGQLIAICWRPSLGRSKAASCASCANCASCASDLSGWGSLFARTLRDLLGLRWWKLTEAVEPVRLRGPRAGHVAFLPGKTAPRTIVTMPSGWQAAALASAGISSSEDASLCNQTLQWQDLCSLANVGQNTVKIRSWKAQPGVQPRLTISVLRAPGRELTSCGRSHFFTTKLWKVTSQRPSPHRAAIGAFGLRPYFPPLCLRTLRGLGSRCRSLLGPVDAQSSCPLEAGQGVTQGISRGCFGDKEGFRVSGYWEQRFHQVGAKRPLSECHCLNSNDSNAYSQSGSGSGRSEGGGIQEGFQKLPGASRGTSPGP